MMQDSDLDPCTGYCWSKWNILRTHWDWEMAVPFLIVVVTSRHTAFREYVKYSEVKGIRLELTHWGNLHTSNFSVCDCYTIKFKTQNTSSHLSHHLDWKQGEDVGQREPPTWLGEQVHSDYPLQVASYDNSLKISDKLLVPMPGMSYLSLCLPNSDSLSRSWVIDTLWSSQDSILWFLKELQKYLHFIALMLLFSLCRRIRRLWNL